MTYIEKIKHYLGQHFNLPEEQVSGMLPQFKDTLSSHMDNLEEVIGVGDMLMIEKAGHTIKGAFLNLGLDESAERAFQIENSAKAEESIDAIVINAKELRKVVDEIIND